jgi:hypothetical protein
MRIGCCDTLNPRCSRLDKDAAAVDLRRICLEPVDAGRPNDLASANVELATVKVTLDDMPFYPTSRKRAGAVSAYIVCNEVIAIDFENGENEPVEFDSNGITIGNVFGVA